MIKALYILSTVWDGNFHNRQTSSLSPPGKRCFVSELVYMCVSVCDNNCRRLAKQKQTYETEIQHEAKLNNPF